MMEKTRHRMYSSMPALALVNIISRLPIKTIIHCQRVCKEWYKLISDNYFAKAYLQRQSSFVCIFLSFDHDFRYLLELNADYNYTCSKNEPIYLGERFNLPRGGTGQVLIGCCNGLFCFEQYGGSERSDRLYISNPMLSECVKIPNPKKKRVCFYDFAFGYSPTNDQYKILRISKKKSSAQSVNSEVEIYTIGVDHSWRHAGKASYPANGKIGNVNLNGILHWVEATHQGGDINIVSFDMKEEKAKVVLSPRDLLGRYRTEVGVLKNCLCIFDSDYHQLDIWWMKEYGVVESWTKDQISTTFSSGFFLPITIWRHEEILMVSSFGYLFSYEPKENKATRVEVSHEGKVCEAILYFPSFFSLRSVMPKDV